MKETINYKLRKPDQEDFYNVEDFNYNADIIDSLLKTNADTITQHINAAAPHSGHAPLVHTHNPADIGAVSKAGDTITGMLNINGDKYAGYNITTNNGNNYSVSIPNITKYMDGMQIKVKFNAASSGPITINVNNLGAKNVVDYFGNPVTNVRANLIANLVYESNSENFILLGKGGGGTAQASDIYVGQTATTDAGFIIGTNPYKIGATIRDSNLKLVLSSGAEIWSLTDVGDAYGIAVDSSGNVYVTYYNNAGSKTVRKLNSSGAEIWSLTDVGNACGIAVDSSGNVYVTYYNSTGSKIVRKLNSSGAEIWSLTDIGNAYGIAVDSSGNVYVTYCNSAGSKNVRKLNSSGAAIWYLTDVGGAHGIAVDSSGNVYVTYYKTSGGKTVRKLNSSGAEIWSLTDVGDAYGIAVDSSGNVYVTYYNNAGSKTVKKLNNQNVYQIIS